MRRVLCSLPFFVYSAIVFKQHETSSPRGLLVISFRYWFLMGCWWYPPALQSLAKCLRNYRTFPVESLPQNPVTSYRQALPLRSTVHSFSTVVSSFSTPSALSDSGWTCPSNVVSELDMPVITRYSPCVEVTTVCRSLISECCEVFLFYASPVDWLPFLLNRSLIREPMQLFIGDTWHKQAATFL